MDDIVTALTEQLTRVLQPLLQIGEPGQLRQLLAALGLNLDALPGINTATITTAVNGVEAALDDLIAHPSLSDIGDLAKVLTDVAAAVADTRAVLESTDLTDLPHDVVTVWNDTVTRLPDLLLTSWVLAEHPGIHHVLTLLGVLTDQAPTHTTPVIADGVALYVPSPVPHLDTTTLLGLIRDPEATLSEQWFGTPQPPTGQAAIDGLLATLWPTLRQVADGAGLPLALGDDPRFIDPAHPLDAVTTQLARQSVVVALGNPSGGSFATGGVLAVTLAAPDTPGQPSRAVVSLDGQFSLTDHPAGLDLTLTADGGPVQAQVDTEGDVTLLGGGEHLGLVLRLAADGSGPDAPALRIGPAAGSHLDLASATATLTATLTSGAAPTVAVELDVSGLSLTVDVGDGDGFLQQAIGTLLHKPLSVSVDVTLGWAWRTGVYLRLRTDASPHSNLTLDIPTSISLGPVTIPQAHVTFAPTKSADGTEQLTFDLTADAHLAIGPVTATVTGIGLRLSLHTAPHSNLGSLQAAADFKPPTGIGLTLSSPTVTGAGFLSLDSQAGRYAGAVALRLMSLSVAAVGLITTKAPDGSRGFSMLVLVSVHFPPIQIGFGISLTGIGGLVAINRTIDVDALAAGLPSGSLDSVMFPAGIETDPTAVVTNLEKYFPSAHGQYVLGPALELQWGADNIVTAHIGVYIEFPQPLRLVLLGQLRMTLPTPSQAIADIHLDVLGSLDLTAHQLWLMATLRDSHVAGFTLTGQAALRAAWGDQPTFVLAVGGFHPAFPAPVGFPTLQRVALALSQGGNPRLRLQAYVALTSNTVQFGARLDLYAGVDIPVLGSFALAVTASVDTLISLHPFAFRIDINLSVALLHNGTPFLAVGLTASLSGPTPWHAVGTATFTFLGTHTIPFEITVGGAAPAAAQPTTRLLPQLLAAFADPGNVAVSAPPAALVTLSGSAPSGLLHPLSTVTISQRLAPLDTQITRLGQAALADPGTFTLTTATLAGRPATTTVTGQFAPGQYRDLDRNLALSTPSFQPATSGVTFAATSLTTSTVVAADTAVHTWVIPVVAQSSLAALHSDTVLPALIDAGVTLVTDEVVLAQAAGAAAARNGALARGAHAWAGPALGAAVTGASYVVADVDNLAPAATIAPSVAPSPAGASDSLVASSTSDILFTSWTLADDYRATLTDTVGLQVVDGSEIVAPNLLIGTTFDADAWYTVTAAHSGERLTVPGDATTDGLVLTQDDPRPGGGQLWRFTPAADGTHVVVNELSHLVLGTPTRQASYGTPVTQNISGAAPAPPWQRWHLVPVGGGGYRIEQLSSGLCLDVVGGPAALAPTIPVQLWEWWGVTNQTWLLSPTPGGALLRQRIRERAYQDWRVRGAPFGTPLADWLRARADVVHETTQLEAWLRYAARGRGTGHALDDWLAAERAVLDRLDMP